MLLVLGIIGILAAVLFGGYGYATRAARKAKAVEAVSNAKDALEILFHRVGNWPRGLFSATTGEQGFRMMDENVAKVFFRYGLLGVDCMKKGDNDYVLRGVDRCGIADPWAQAVLKRADKNKSGKSLLSEKVPSGGYIRNHLIYFAVDEDDDGFVTKTEGAPVDKVRAKAIAWCAGEDGVLGLVGNSAEALKARADNVYSWQRGQEQKK